MAKETKNKASSKNEFDKAKLEEEKSDKAELERKKKELEQKEKLKAERQKKREKKELKRIKGLIEFPFKAIFYITMLLSLLVLNVLFFGIEIDIYDALFYAFMAFIGLSLVAGTIFVTYIYFKSENKIQELEQIKIDLEQKKLQEEEQKRKDEEERAKEEARIREEINRELDSHSKRMSLSSTKNNSASNQNDDRNIDTKNDSGNDININASDELNQNVSLIDDSQDVIDEDILRQIRELEQEEMNK